MPDLSAIPSLRGRNARKHLAAWLNAVSRARRMPEREQPEQTVPGDGPPPAHRWAERDPEAAARLAAARTVVAAIADEHTMPTENLLQPDAVRRLAWSPPADPTPEKIASFLRRFGARAWQTDLVAVPLSRALQRLEEG
jgi:ribonuclease D